MQENEKYGIELEAKTNLFKKGIQEAIKYTKAFGQGVKESFSEQFKEQANNWRSSIKNIFTKTDYEKEIEDLKNQKKDIVEQIKSNRGESDLEELQTKYNEIVDKIFKLRKEQKEYNGELEETEQLSSKTNVSLSNLFDGSISKIKRFTYYLLGARSVFSLFMKYRSAYYQFNEEMQYQSELSTNALALSLGPAFEFLGNVIAYASIGLAKFIELLTNVPILSKVTTKGIRDYNKSLKETQTLVSGIDEITNLTNPQTLGLADQYKALADFQKKIAEVEKFFADNKWITDLANGLKLVWEKLKEVYNYIKEHWDVFKYLLGGVALGLLSQNFTFGISIIGLTAFISFVKAIEDYNKAKKEYDENHKSTHDLILGNFSEMTKNFLTDTKQHFKEIKKGTDEWHKSVKDVKRTLPSVLKEIENGELTYEEYKPVIDEWISSLKELDSETFKPEIDFLTKLNGSDDDIALIKAYFSTGNPNARLSSGKAGGMGGFGGGTSGSRELNYNVDVDTTEAQSQLNDVGKTGVKAFQDIIDKAIELSKRKYKIQITTEIVSKIGEGATATANALSQAIVKSIRGYASGLDYVPYDNYPALLHKGEAVVPAKYNPTIHSQGNDYTNSLLETLILKVDDLASRPNIFEIDGQQFANATYGLYDTERKKQGYIEGVIR